MAQFVPSYIIEQKTAKMLHHLSRATGCDFLFPNQRRCWGIGKVLAAKLNLRCTEERSGNMIWLVAESSSEHRVFLASRGPGARNVQGAFQNRVQLPEKLSLLFPALPCHQAREQNSQRGRTTTAKYGGPFRRFPGRWSRPCWWRSSLAHCLQTDCRRRRERGMHVTYVIHSYKNDCVAEDNKVDFEGNGEKKVFQFPRHCSCSLEDSY